MTKKLIVKLATYTAISIMLAIQQLGISAYALPPAGTEIETAATEAAAALAATEANRTAVEELRTAMDGVVPCIDTTGADANKIITIIEEPLRPTNSDQECQDITDGQICKCYRHVFMYTDPGTKKTFTLPVLGKTPCTATRGRELETTYRNKDNATLTSEEDDFNVAYSCREIQVLKTTGGTSLIYTYIGMIYRWGASVVGIVAVLVIVISGIQISASGGDPEAINKSKTRIIQSLSGIAILFLSGIILYTINPDFFTK